MTYRSQKLTQAVARIIQADRDYPGVAHDVEVVRRALTLRRECLNEVRAKAENLLQRAVFQALAQEEEELARALAKRDKEEACQK